MDTKAKISAIACAMLLACAISPAGLRASADEQPGAALFSPSSFEQYLDLESPDDIAFGEHYIAIADGGTLYLYDRAQESYRTISLSDGGSFTGVDFAGDRLFVSENGVAGNFMYEYSHINHSLVRLSFNCTAFCIADGIMYTANTSGETHIGAYDVASIANETPAAHDLGIISESKTPTLTVAEGVVYCGFNDRIYYPGGTTGTGWASFLLTEQGGNVSAVNAVCAHGGSLYFSTNDGLYIADVATGNSTRILSKQNYFGALTSFQDKLYAAGGSAIHEIDPRGALGAYEISAASSSVGRLRGATDSVRTGDLLITADAGNGRISVTSLSDRTTRVIPCIDDRGDPFTPNLVASDGNIIAVSAEDAIYLYRVGEETFYYRHATSGPAVGLACVYGSCYYITESEYGKAAEGRVSFRRAGTSPRALTSDLYGALYVADAEGRVERYTEAGFIDPAMEHGDPVTAALPTPVTSLRADAKGNLYSLSGGDLYCNGQPFYTLSDKQFVYQHSDMPRSFALGYEDGSTYVLYENYIVKTEELAIPTLTKLDASGVGERVFTPHGADSLFVDIPAGTLAIRTALEPLKEAPAYFPYRAHYRTEEDIRGVLLAEQGDYALVAVYEVTNNARTLTAQLFRLGEVQKVPTSSYFEEANADMYLSSDVSVYDFPCIHTALAEGRLARGTAVAVQGYIHAPERDYALISYDGGTGYVPASYLTDIAPIPQTAGEHELGWLKANSAGVLFTAEDGSELLVTERTRVDLFAEEEGFTARFTRDGKIYSAHVTQSMVDRGESDALRISLIVILTVVAVGIVGAYVFLVPKYYADQRKRP